MYYQINIVGIKLRAPSPPNFCASKSQYYKYASSGVSKPNMCQFISDLNYSFRQVLVSVVMHFFFGDNQKPTDLQKIQGRLLYYFILHCLL